MQQVELTPEWRDWILTNVKRQCSVESMIAAMSEKAFDPVTAAKHVAQVLKETEPTRPTAVNAAPSQVLDFEYETGRIPAGPVIQTRDRQIPVAMRMSRPELVLLHAVLSSDECEALIARSQAKLTRSTTVDPATGMNNVIANRSSRGTYFHLEEDEFIANIDQRLSDITNWPVERSEGIQILNYEMNGEYKPHFDYFPPDHSGSSVHLEQGGQRIGTVIMYLNDVEAGGETIFPEISLSITPRKGDAVYFGYCNSRGQVDRLTLHGGAPVRHGAKWIATKWLRQHKR